MKKSTLFLSAAITTFILAVLASVIYTARASASQPPTPTVVPAAVTTEAPTQTLQPVDTATLAPTATSAFISPQDAVSIASKALGNTQVYSVDTVNRYGKDAYKVTFSSGHVVFVNPKGIILAIDSPQAAYVASAPAQQSGNQQQSSNQQSSSDNSPASPTQKSDDGGGGSSGDN
jgi:hypothetical protein